jgi:hypothetical protein
MATNQSPANLSIWRERIQKMQADTEFITQRNAGKNQRIKALPEMQSMLSDFLRGKSTLAAFRETFQKKTQKDWRDFGLNGFSGAMVLNMLVKNIPNQVELTQQLVRVLTIPKTVEAGQHQMTNFIDYLHGLVASNQINKTDINIGFIPFLISAFWHIQRNDEYPIFYPTSRTALVKDSIYIPTDNDVAHYFTFQNVFTKLARTLGLTLWALEDVCIWQVQRGTTKTTEAILPTSPIEVVNHPDELSEANSKDEDRPHARTQHVLAEIGKYFKYNVWIAANDHSKTWNGKRLGDLSVEKLPSLGFDAKTQRTVELIDVLWLKGRNQVVAAFEVEHSTSIYSGLLRMSDLVLLAPNIAFSLYIVTSKNRLHEVRTQLRRPTFQEIKLNEICGIFDYENLFENAEHIKKFGKDIEALSGITEYVPDTEEE